MSVPKIFWNYFSFFSAAVISVLLATIAVDFIEETSRDQIKKELLAGGVNWADIETIGLQVFLIGNAPDEASRFNAISLAGNVVDAERLIAGQITMSFNSGYGFTAIIVAFLGRLNPLGILMAGLLMALTYIGGEIAQLMLGLPGASIQLLQGMLLFFLLATDIFTNYSFKIRGS